MPSPEYLTLQEVAAKFRVDPRTVRRWVANDQLAAIRIGGRLLRFRPEDVEALLQVTR